MKQWINNLLRRPAEAAHLKTGRWGERQAVRLLKKKHYRILGERVRIGKRDEIDIVARQRNALVFVEVKTRTSEQFGRPFSAVTSKKRKNLSRAAVAYLRREKIRPDYIRFDVIEIVGERGTGKPEQRHIENAFPLDASYRLWW